MPRWQIEWDGDRTTGAAGEVFRKALGAAAHEAADLAGVAGLTLEKLTPTFAERIAHLRGPEGERHMTRTGRVVNRFAPLPEDWDLEALVWAQANLCRYGGEMHASPDAEGRVAYHPFYSTCEHELHALRAVDILYPDLAPVERARLKIYAGVHDKVEVRFSDIISVVKAMFPDVKAYEHLLETSFLTSQGLDPVIPAEIDAIDKRLVANEGPALFPGTDRAFWDKRTGGRLPIPGIVIPDPAFVVRVPLAAAQRREGLADIIEFSSFPPLVARALLDELAAARRVLDEVLAAA